MSPITEKLPPGVYLVATPLGSARDITLRALDILASADVLVAEDTRTARRLMTIHGITLGQRPLWAYHDHSKAHERDNILAQVTAGKSVAYMSEAGTPMIADPGYQLVKAAQEQGLKVTAAPGPSAAINALVLAGLPTDRFVFAGFLPAAKEARKKALQDLMQMKSTLVVYETAKRMPAFLDTLATVFGSDHKIVLCREMTKRFEEVSQTTPAALLQRIADAPLKGEIVLVIAAQTQTTTTADDLDTAILNALLTMRVKDAADSVAGALGLPRRQIYQRALDLKNKKLDE